VNNLSKQQILALVSKMYNGEGYYNEEEINADIDLLEKNVADPEVTNYIFSTKYNLTPEEIVEKALSYKPIITPPPKKE
jgi:hypothetical protein